jgi:hypothetical protein
MKGRLYTILSGYVVHQVSHGNIVREAEILSSLRAEGVSCGLLGCDAM